MLRNGRWFSILLGCSGACHQAAVIPRLQTEPATVVSVPDRSAAWDSAERVLRDHRFRLDRLDERRGVLTTHAEGSQHFFEFWRNDVAGPADFWEATICPIRRWVEVRFDDDADPTDGCTVRLAVHKQRYSTPERQFNTSAAAFRFFSPDVPTVSTGAPPKPQDSYWIDLGRDRLMERLLLERITAGMGTPTTSQ